VSNLRLSVDMNQSQDYLRREIRGHGHGSNTIHTESWHRVGPVHVFPPHWSHGCAIVGCAFGVVVVVGGILVLAGSVRPVIVYQYIHLIPSTIESTYKSTSSHLRMCRQCHLRKLLAPCTSYLHTVHLVVQYPRRSEPTSLDWE
jgi:hypothetical protein